MRDFLAAPILLIHNLLGGLLSLILNKDIVTFIIEEDSTTTNQDDDSSIN